MAGTSLGGTHPTIANLTPILTDTAANSSYLLLGTITGSPDTTASVYQLGCMLMATDTGVSYVNTGTVAVPVWSIMSSLTAATPMYAKSNANGANNAICVSIFQYGTTKVTLTTGSRILVKLAHTLQAGANTINVNGTTKSIVCHTNPASNIHTTYQLGGVIDLVYTPGVGSGVFQDMAW